MQNPGRTDPGAEAAPAPLRGRNRLLAAIPPELAVVPP